MTMSEGNRSEGRKRARNALQSRQPKKAKRLSSIALRALAALASDNSSEDEGLNDRIDEGDATGYHYHQRSESPSGLRTHSKSAVTRPGSTIDSNAIPFAVSQGTEISDVRFPGYLHLAVAKENGPDSHAENVTKNSSFRTNDHSDKTKIIDGNLDVGDKNNGKQPLLPAPHTIDASQLAESSGVCQAAATGTTVDGEADTVLPPAEDSNSKNGGHSVSVFPHAVISRFGDVLSSFLSTPFDDQLMLSLHKLKERPKPDRKKELKGKDKVKTRISLCRDVPITPQKEFIQSIRSKQTSSSKEGHDLTRPISSVAISSEVSSFLVQECSRLFDVPPMLNNVNLANHHHAQARGGAPHGPPHQHMHSHPNRSFTDPSFLNSHKPFPQQDPLYQHVSDRQNTRQLSPPSVPTANINTAQAIFTPAASHTQCITKQKPKVATAKAEIKLTNVDKGGEAHKLPVAFGYWLDDGNASKHVAWKGTRDWVAQGKEAVDADALKLGVASHLGSNRAKNVTSSRMQVEPRKKKPRRNLNLPQPEPAGIDFPAGWTTRTFERTGRSSTYKVWYSPWTKAKFRSKKSARIFLKILGEPGMNDEQKAFNLFKSRGHKL